MTLFFFLLGGPELAFGGPGRLFVERERPRPAAPERPAVEADRDRLADLASVAEAPSADKGPVDHTTFGSSLVADCPAEVSIPSIGEGAAAASEGTDVGAAAAEEDADEGSSAFIDNDDIAVQVVLPVQRFCYVV